jgi:hypothetical protein
MRKKMNRIIFLLLIFLVLNDGKQLRHQTRRYKKSKTILPTTSTPTTSTTTNDHDTAAITIMNITVKVGETVTLKCSIDYKFENNAGVIWMRKSASVLTLNTNRITEDQRFDVDYQHRNDRHNYYLTILNVQISDESEYICETSSTIENYEYTTIHSLINLHITRK